MPTRTAQSAAHKGIDTMKAPITSTQAMAHPAVVETINALGAIADELRAERDALTT